MRYSWFLSILAPCLIAPISGCSDTSSADGARGPKAYVGLFGDNAVAVVDLRSSKTITTIPVSAPDGLVITPDGAKVYVSSNDSGAVQVIDTARDRTQTTIAVGAQPAGLSITPDGRYVVASVQGDGRAVIIDTRSDSVVAAAPVGKAHSSGLSSDGALAFVSSQVTDAPSVDVVHVPDGAAGPSFPLDAAPRALCDLDGTLYATVVGSASLHVLDASTGQARPAIETAGSPHDIRPSTDGSFLFTVSQTANEFEVIDPSSSTITARIPTGAMPHWIALSTNGASAYVTDEGDDDLAVIDLGSLAVTHKIPLGKAPRKLAVKP
jgi:YVTN family beta-propeller protein